MHGPDKKPSRGVCQICGRAVVAFEYEHTGGCIRGGPTFTNGHEYNRNGKLANVRCPEHWNGLRVNRQELERAPTEDELELASKIRGSIVEAPVVPPPRDPNVFTFPVLRQAFPTLIAADIVSVQPMTAPLTIEALPYRYKSMSDNISYKGIDEADLVFALHNGTGLQGFGMLQNKPGLTLADVKRDLAEMDEKGYGKLQGSYSFDYYYGRPLKVTLDTEKKEIRRPDLYDRDAGPGTISRILAKLRSKQA